ncbi:diguanylate cyclase [Deinococcus aquaticus]|uniref:tetratricopeptide repeat-containing diguanylate cyclase n=1 Tax=Deinococcus aquaticus TaxID=328692 RepID=UPI003F4900E5
MSVSALAEQAWSLRFTDPGEACALAGRLADGAAHACPPEGLRQGAYAQVVLGFLSWRDGNLLHSLEQVTQAETTLRALNDERWLVRALSVQAVLLGDLGEGERALRILQEQLELVRRTGDLEMEASANNDFGVQISWDDPARALHYYQRAYDLLEGADPPHPSIQGIAALNMAEVHLQQQNLDLGDALTERGGQLLLEAQAWSFWPFYVTLRATALVREARFGDARTLISEAFTRLGDHQSAAGQPGPDPIEPVQVLRITAARTEYGSGRPDRALMWLSDMETWTTTRSELKIEFLDLRASIQAELGDHAAAYRSVRQLLDVSRARHAYERDTQIKSLEVMHRTDLAVQQSREAEQAAQQLREHLAQLQTLKGQLEKLSTTDELTSLGNRRQFEYDRALLAPDDAVLVVDIDYFKRVNDTHGHSAGDVTLREVADRISGALRRSDRAYRYGGEEFTVILRGVGCAHLLEVAERIRVAVAAAPITAIRDTVTVSIGAATVGGRTPDGTLGAADRALYRAKNEGRNRISVDAPPPAGSRAGRHRTAPGSDRLNP